MKKLALALLIVVMTAGAALADVCVVVQRDGHWMDEWTQGEVNKLSVEERREYDSRIQPLDIIDIFEAWRCPDTGTTGSPTFAIIIYGLDIAEAGKYLNPWMEFDYTDPIFGDVYFTKRLRKFKVHNGTMPAALKNIIDTEDRIEMQWADIRDFLENKHTGSIGE